MPLRDHFHRPGRGSWPWTSVHFQWAGMITRQLNQKSLPPGYVALPHIQVGSQGQVDVATLHDDEEAPPKPALVVPTDLADVDTIEIEVFNEEDGPRLVAAVELVSPANKVTPAGRRAYLEKRGECKKQGAGLVEVDLVLQGQPTLEYSRDGLSMPEIAVRTYANAKTPMASGHACRTAHGRPRAMKPAAESVIPTIFT